MEQFRKEMDKSILNSLKDKIEIYLKRHNYASADFIRENLDRVSGLYVENLTETRGCNMQSRGATKDRPEEIVIDKKFAIFDDNGNPIGIDENSKKLIMTQLTHELLHSGARYYDPRFNKSITGIQRDNGKRGLNEGFTQMFTEKIWGYTLSPHADAKYKNYKGIAKVLDATFGEDVSTEAYFSHSDILEKECFRITNNSSFYNDLNKYMSSHYYVTNPEKINESDGRAYYSNLMYPVRAKISESLHQKVCAEIIVPKLKSLNEDEQKKYLTNVMTAFKEEEFVSVRMANYITKYMNLSPEELASEKSSIDSSLVNLDQERQLIEDLFKSNNVLDVVDLSPDGKTITSKQYPNLSLDSDQYREILLSKLYFQNSGISKDVVQNNVRRLCENFKNNNKLSFGDNISLEEKKRVFAVFKVAARENGYLILNSLDDCEKGNDIRVNAVKIKAENEEILDFQDLKRIYETFEVEYQENNPMNFKVINRATGKEENDTRLIKLASFATSWVSAAGIKWMQGEQLPGISYAFNDSSERLYNTFGEKVKAGLEETGSINTTALYDELSEDGYKHSEEIIRNLTRTNANMHIVYEYYKKQIGKTRLETKISKPSLEYIQGYTPSLDVDFRVDCIMKDISKKASEPTIDKEEILTNTVPDNNLDNSERYLEDNVYPYLPESGYVILKNGNKIPNRQFVEEFVLGECQEKYNGDFSRYVSIKTMNNEGTININGNPINRRQITDYINKDLLNKQVVLPNGYQISGKRFIEDVYSKYIPENGKVILSNGNEIPAVQYIEEFILGEELSKYNGKLYELLYNTTIKNTHHLALSSLDNEYGESSLSQGMRKA